MYERKENFIMAGLLGQALLSHKFFIRISRNNGQLA